LSQDRLRLAHSPFQKPTDWSACTTHAHSYDPNSVFFRIQH
jgi:hypothetical protein